MRHSKIPRIVIWAHSFCRSTVATYLELANEHPANVEIVMCGSPDPELRARAGFRSDEFDSTRFISIAPSRGEALRFLASRGDWVHMFCAYHGNPLFEALIEEAISSGIEYFIASEAPQNMEQTVVRRIAKEIYIRTILRAKVHNAIENSRFILNYSGHSVSRFRQIGWPLSKIEDFGYFPPPLTQARQDLLLPDRNDVAANGTMHFLLSGTHCQHKSPMTLVEAVEHLVRWGMGGQFKCTITGEGLQTDKMRKRSKQNDLPIKFLGFIDIDELILLYSTADVFVATGVNEPWGIRVNDVMQLGLPGIVSTGMGATAIIQQNENGWTYQSGSSLALAEKMRSLIENTDSVKWAQNRLKCSLEFSPSMQARRIVRIIESRF